MRVRSLAVCALALLAVALPARAQSHKWWHSERFKQQLGLTPDQSARIEEIFQTTMPRLREGKEELDRLEKSLSKAIAESAVDEPQLARQIDRVEAARSELAKTRTLMLFRMRRVLTPEQRAKLSALHDHDRRSRDRRKPSSR